MSYDDDEIVDGGFKMDGDSELDEPLDMPEEIPEIEDDPENRYH